MVSDILYWALLGAFFTHELDAVKRHEWRVLPFLRAMPDAMGEQVFIWVHVPLFAAILMAGTDDGVRLGISAFAVLHVGLHWLFRRHPAYEFNNASSWALILLTGALGAGYVVAAVG
ncbi:MAG: hypothetical protein O9325_03550 [Roseomonas sp.]|nr:hypothetical protein [Roseomonas sp.]